MVFGADTERALAALSKVATIWQTRLNGGWSPPEGSPFPWAQVRLSLAALLPGMRSAREWVERTCPHPPTADHSTVTLVLAGNTPLLAWSPLCACLMAGVGTVRVKLSRDETVWTRLFVDTLREADPEQADRIELYDFPGEDERTYALLEGADAVIAYGSDAAIEELRLRTPRGVPFFGYGHAVSLGLITNYAECHHAARGFARDVLMFNQQGCLSPHIIYVSGDYEVVHFGRIHLPTALARQVEEWNLPAVTDTSIAQTVREARDVALFSGFNVEGDPGLRWTVITSVGTEPYPTPVGHNIVYVSLVQEYRDRQGETGHPVLQTMLKPVKGILSSVGLAGKMSDVAPFGWQTSLFVSGVSRFCKPGEMQTPPLDWQNGNRDLLAELLRLRT